jgi:uncharacterized membrane protein YdfJ with MMPL/SSD domain
MPEEPFIVRTLLVPSLVTVFGDAGYWPGRPPVPAEDAGQGQVEPAPAEA